MYVVKCLIRNNDMFLGEIFWKNEYRQYWVSHREKAIKYYEKTEAEDMIREIIKRNSRNKEYKKRLIVEEITE